MKNLFNAILWIALVGTIMSCSDDDPVPQPPIENEISVPEGYELVWSDEFENSTINMQNWQYETGDGTDYGLQPGWGNNERQIYTSGSANSGIEEVDGNSSLFIKALSDGMGGYTSAKLTTQNKFSMRYGRLEARAKMPEGQGIWSAIWMLGDNIDEISWPGCGEIDIIEVLGNEPDKMYSTVHYTNANKSKGEQQGDHTLSSGTYSSGFNTFAMEWDPESLSFYVNDILVREIMIDDGMKEFLRDFYLIVNVAVGGNWPGDPDASTSFPQQMNIDYIRVFEKEGFDPPAAPELSIDEETIGQTIEPSIAQDAIKDDFTDLGNASILVWGGGGEPNVGSSEEAIDGDASAEFNFPGGNWGGGYMELESPVDLSAYSTVKFALKMPEDLAKAEIKIESTSVGVGVDIANYTGTDVGQGFKEYSIPLSDFEGVDLTQIKIPFAMWNPVNDSEEFGQFTVLIDQLYFE